MAFRGLRAAFCLLALGSCQTATYSGPASITFETATAWIYQGADSTALRVEIARSRPEQELGLSGRSVLEPGSGMLFAFEETRSGDDGFWMVGVEVPLDIAFLDDEGRILRILTMDLCQDSSSVDTCPGYYPDVEYRSALEVNRGWFTRNGIGVGARVVVVP